MMFKRKPPEVELTNETYSRWLRAQRPPWDWFLRQQSLIQEQLAILGDEYVDGCIAAGTPEPAETEEAAVRRLAAEAAGRLLNGSGSATHLGMGGVTQRQQAAVQARQEAKDDSRRLFGRPPDSYSVCSKHRVRHDDCELCAQGVPD